MSSDEQSLGGYERDPLLAELYDANPTYSGRRDTAFFVEIVAEFGDRVLELGCGTGRVLLPTVRKGYAVTGLDASEHMLERCRAKVDAEPDEIRGRVQLVHAPMTDFDLGEEFDVVTMPFRPIQHLVTVGEQIAALTSANRHLRRGGGLVFDVFNPDPSRLRGSGPTDEELDTPTVALPDGRRFRRTHRVTRFRPMEQVNDVELIHYVTARDGTERCIVQAFPFRYYWRYELEHLLARCGFGVREVYGDYDRSPLTVESAEMIFVAEKEHPV